LHLSGIITSKKFNNRFIFHKKYIPPAPKKSVMVLAGGSDSNGHDNNMIIKTNLKGEEKEF
jgi:hypothetical protein